jgi:hypothetical protein
MFRVNGKRMSGKPLRKLYVSREQQAYERQTASKIKLHVSRERQAWQRQAALKAHVSRERQAYERQAALKDMFCVNSKRMSGKPL